MLSVSYDWDLGAIGRLLLVGRFNRCNRVLLGHVTVEQAVIKEVLSALHALYIVTADIIELDLTHGCLDVSDEVHEVPLLQAGLVLHVGANSLNWGEVAQVAILSESGGKSALRAIEELRVGKLVFGLLRTDESRGWSSLH